MFHLLLTSELNKLAHAFLVILNVGLQSLKMQDFATQAPIVHIILLSFLFSTHDFHNQFIELSQGVFTCGRFTAHISATVHYSEGGLQNPCAYCWNNPIQIYRTDFQSQNISATNLLPVNIPYSCPYIFFMRSYTFCQDLRLCEQLDPLLMADDWRVQYIRKATLIFFCAVIFM